MVKIVFLYFCLGSFYAGKQLVKIKAKVIKENFCLVKKYYFALKNCKWALIIKLCLFFISMFPCHVNCYFFNNLIEY